MRDRLAHRYFEQLLFGFKQQVAMSGSGHWHTTRSRARGWQRPEPAVLVHRAPSTAASPALQHGMVRFPQPVARVVSLAVLVVRRWRVPSWDKRSHQLRWTMTVRTTAPGSGESFRAGPVGLRVLDDGTVVNGRMGVVELSLTPGWPGPPQHIHRCARRDVLRRHGHGALYQWDRLFVAAKTNVLGGHAVGGAVREIDPSTGRVLW